MGCKVESLSLIVASVAHVGPVFCAERKPGMVPAHVTQIDIGEPAVGAESVLVGLQSAQDVARPLKAKGLQGRQIEFSVGGHQCSSFLSCRVTRALSARLRVRRLSAFFRGIWLLRALPPLPGRLTAEAFRPSALPSATSGQE